MTDRGDDNSLSLWARPRIRQRVVLSLGVLFVVFVFPWIFASVIQKPNPGVNWFRVTDEQVRGILLGDDVPALVDLASQNMVSIHSASDPSLTRAGIVALQRDRLINQPREIRFELANKVAAQQGKFLDQLAFLSWDMTRSGRGEEHLSEPLRYAICEVFTNASRSVLDGRPERFGWNLDEDDPCAWVVFDDITHPGWPMTPPTEEPPGVTP